MRAYVIALAALLSLAGCGLPPTVFHTDKNSELLKAPPLQDSAIGGIWIGPITGATADASAFRRRLARALVKREVAAGTEVAGAYSAKLLSAAAPATFDGRGYVDVWWRLEGPDGTIWDAFAVKTPLDFRVERGETLTAINTVAARLAGILGPPPTPAQTNRAIIVAVPPAKTKGFEDGGPLARAMAAQLAAKGLQPGPIAGAHAIIRIQAAIASVKASGQEAVRVRIRWAVVTPDGKEIGAADQKNLLPLDSIDAGLASIAPTAAAAAVDAIARLVGVAARQAAAKQSVPKQNAPKSSTSKPSTGAAQR